MVPYLLKSQPDTRQAPSRIQQRFADSKCAFTYNKMIDSVEDWAEVGGEGILHLWAAQLHQPHSEILNNVL